MSLVKILLEMPKMEYDPDQKVVVADKAKLRDLKVEDVLENIVVIRQPKDSMMFPEGFTLVYFMDTPENAKKMGQGKFDYIIIPQGTPMGMGRETAFEKAFKQKGKEGIEHIMGFIQGYSDEEEIFIDFMRVRHKLKRNTINKKMIQALEREFPSAEVTFSKPTDQGKAFIDKEYQGAETK